MGSLFRTWTGQSGKSQQQPQNAPQFSRQSTKDSLQKVSSVASTSDPWAGHLNHLSEAQEKALGQFKSVLYDQSLYFPSVATGRSSHDDATLLRFLRARKFDVNAALGQFKDTENWRKTNNIQELYEKFDVEFYEKARTMYPQWTGRRDRRGIPLYVYAIKHLDGKNVNAYTKDSAKMKAESKTHSNSKVSSKMLPLFALYENMLNFVLPLCDTLERPNLECPATNCTNIVDVSNVGLKQFWNLKGHMQEASTLATAHYPETLDRIFILGAPSFFPTVWGWIKRWFDPVTVSKIFILAPHEVKPTLEKFIDVENIPKAYGGSLDWNFGELPALDQAAAGQCNKLDNEWVTGPVLWEKDQRIPVGTVHGELRRPVSTMKDSEEKNGHNKETPNSVTSNSSPLQHTPHPGQPTLRAERSGELPLTSQESSVLEALDTKAAKTSHINGIGRSEIDFVPEAPSEATTLTSGTAPAQENDIEIDQKTNGVSKPPIERFETAAETLPRSNGVVA
ncbi:MAG: hypothetical protein Q9227_004427 [Pyrenula ochraceoflavens]